MKNNNNNQDAGYWKLQYEQLKKQKRLFYNNDANQQLIVQLQEKCQKQEQTINQLNSLIKQNSPLKAKDSINEAEIVKIQYQTLLDEKDTIIVSLQRDNLNIQNVALEQLKRSDNHIESQRFQIQQMKIQIDDLNQLINHLQQKLQQEQQETKEFKDKIILCEKMNEALEQTIDTLNNKLQTNKEKSNKELAQMMSRYKKNDQEYQNIKHKLEEISRTQFGKYSSENQDLCQIVDKILDKILLFQEENKQLKQQNINNTSEINNLNQQIQTLQNEMSSLQIELQNANAQINYQKLIETQQKNLNVQDDENKEVQQEQEQQDEQLPIISIKYQEEQINEQKIENEVEEQNQVQE